MDLIYSIPGNCINSSCCQTENKIEFSPPLAQTPPQKEP